MREAEFSFLELFSVRNKKKFFFPLGNTRVAFFFVLKLP